MTSRFRLLLVVLFAVVGLSSTAQDAPLQPLPFFASFIPNVQFAPLYVAIEEGYFADAGYDFQIQHGDENIGVIQIAQSDPKFGLISGEQVLMARAAGIPVVYLYTWFMQFPVAVVARDGVEMDSPDDLAGLRVGIPGPFGASYTALTALLASAGLTEADLQLESIGYVAPDVLCAGGVDAAVVYINNEPLEIQRRIDAGQCGDVTGITVLPVADFANIASNGIVTNEDVVKNEGSLVWTVTTAFDQGVFDTATNPARAYLHSLNHVENLPQSQAFIDALEGYATEFDALLATLPSPDDIAVKRIEVRDALREAFEPAELAQFEVLLATIELWDHPLTGIIDDNAWLITRDTMAMMGSIPADFDITGAYISDFIPMGIDYEGAAPIAVTPES
ncbi:MAG: ABC transporter substrate-binding protein [Chloroflexi bacterium]|nr:ABC transporter substrate-binding protein [Chloroflexota bacterium]